MLEGTTPTLRTTPQAYINLSNNKLSGEVNWSFSLSAAKINLSWNEFSGVFWLPPEGSLKEFDISHNKFTKFFTLSHTRATFKIVMPEITNFSVQFHHG